MEFSLSEEQELLRNTAQAFAAQHLRPRAREFERRGLSEDCLRAYRTIGFPLMLFSVEDGGAGTGAVEKVVAVEELSWGDAGSVLALESRSCLAPLLVEVPASLRERLRYELAQDDARVGLIWDSRGTLARDGTRWSGTIPLVVPAPLHWLLVRREDELALFSRSVLAERPVAIGALHASGASEVLLDGAEPEWSARREQLGERLSALVRLTVAAALLGVTRAAHEYALAYARERVVFGKPISAHQGPAFELADMRISIEAVRGLLWRAAYAWDQHEPQAELYAALAYLEAAEAALSTTRDAVQLLGGHGFLRDHPVEKWMREARALTLLWGGRDAASEDAARWVAGSPSRTEHAEEC